MGELHGRAGRDSGDEDAEGIRAAPERGALPGARDSPGRPLPGPLTDPEARRRAAWIELLRRDIAETGADNVRLRQENSGLRAQNEEFRSELADLRAQVAALVAKDAARDRADMRRDSEIATLKWNDILKEERTENAGGDAGGPTVRWAEGADSRLLPASGQAADRATPERSRRGPSDQAIGFLAAAGTSAMALSAEYLRFMPSHLVNSSAAAFGLTATGIAWLRANREERHGDRPADREAGQEDARPRHARRAG